jgi:16S rRNA processing protein RimM
VTGPTGPLKIVKKEEKMPDKSSDSLKSELRYLAIGQVIRAHGVRGEISVIVLTDFPERFATMEWVYLGDQTEAKSFHLEKYRWHKQNVLLTLAGVTTRTQAEKLRGQLVQIPIEEAMPLPEGSYYPHQLLGLQVMTSAGQRLGVVTDILETGANDVYVIKGESQTEILLPAIPDVVKAIDLEKGQIVVELLDGLI